MPMPKAGDVTARVDPEMKESSESAPTLCTFVENTARRA
jgi:hypothetical protein